MSSISYLPHVSPKDDNTRQMRRRVNNIVSQVSQQVGAVATDSGDLGTLSNEVQTKAPSASPILSHVTQDTFATLTNATIHTTANAGGASALPATPAGYTTITINGQRFKLPLYLL